MNPMVTSGVITVQNATVTEWNSQSRFALSGGSGNRRSYVGEGSIGLLAGRLFSAKDEIPTQSRFADLGAALPGWFVRQIKSGNLLDASGL